MQGTGSSVDPAAGNRADVVGIDIQANGHGVLVFQATIGRHTAERFRQQYRRAPMQNAKRLNRAFIDRHAAFHIVVTDLKVFNAHVTDGSFLAVCHHLVKIGGYCPYCHGGISPD